MHELARLRPIARAKLRRLEKRQKIKRAKKEIVEFAKHIGADISEVKMVLRDADDSIKNKISDLLKNLDISKKTVVFSPAIDVEDFQF